MKEMSLQPIERKRVYVFSDERGRSVIPIRDVVRVCVSDSGNHYIDTADGRKFIVMSGFLAIDIDADEWSHHPSMNK